jgi:hypothetical protein
VRARSVRVDAQDLRVSAIGAQEERMKLAGQVPVRSVGAGAGDESQVFQPRHVHAVDFEQVVAHGLSDLQS